MNVQALTFGRAAADTLLQGDVGTTVLAVFSQGCYMAYGNTLLLLHDAYYGSISFGIGIEGAQERLRANGVAAGMPVRLEGQSLQIGNGLRVALPMNADERKTNENRLTRKQIGAQLLDWLQHTERGVAKGILADMLPLAQAARFMHVRNEYCDIAKPGIQLLLQGCGENNAQYIEQGLHGIIGLGPGLTPSMDDWLTGYLYGMHWIANTALGRCACLRTACRLSQKIAVERTTAISAAYIAAAAEGAYIALLEDTLTQPRACTRLLEVGNHSGADMLTGLVMAILM